MSFSLRLTSPSDQAAKPPMSPIWSKPLDALFDTVNDELLRYITSWLRVPLISTSLSNVTSNMLPTTKPRRSSNVAQFALLLHPTASLQAVFPISFTMLVALTSLLNKPAIMSHFYFRPQQPLLPSALQKVSGLEMNWHLRTAFLDVCFVCISALFLLLLMRGSWKSSLDLVEVLIMNKTKNLVHREWRLWYQFWLFILGLEGRVFSISGSVSPSSTAAVLLDG